MKKSVLSLVATVVFAASTIAAQAQTGITSQAMGGSAPRPQAMGGSAPRPQAMGGSAPRPQAVSTFSGILGALIMYFGF
jgi:hypothetical protein